MRRGYAEQADTGGAQRDSGETTGEHGAQCSAGRGAPAWSGQTFGALREQRFRACGAPDGAGYVLRSARAWASSASTWIRPLLVALSRAARKPAASAFASGAAVLS